MMDTALFAFDIDGLNHGRLIRPFDALSWMQALEATLFRLSCINGQGSTCFAAGETQETSRAHSLLLLPIAHDARYARVDQVLVHAPRGFDENAILALQRVRSVDKPGQSPAVVVLVEIGAKADFLKKVGHFECTDVWRSVTPLMQFDADVSKGLDGLENALAAELEAQGLPRCTQVEIALERERFFPLTVLREALAAGNISPESPRMSAPRPPAATEDGLAKPVFGLRVRFEQPVRGPISLGPWARYGMGQFVPG